MRIFVAAPIPIEPDRYAGHSRFYEILQVLASQHRVDLWMPDEKYARGASRLLTKVGVNLIQFTETGLKFALTFSHYHVGLFEFFAMAEWILPYFRAKQPWSVAIIDSVDVHFVREAAAAKLGLIDQEVSDRTRTRELQAYQSADAVIAASEPDAEVLRREKIKTLFVVPTISHRRERVHTDRQRELVFVGGFKHPPNVDGLLWFASSIWPLVRATCPEARLTVVGSDPPPEVAALNGLCGVTIAGYVPDVVPYLDRAVVSVAPLRYGGGMKGKVTEAALAGLPIVTTKFGIQGLPLRSGVDAFVADSPEDFAAAAIALLQNPDRAREMGLSGQRAVATLCTPEAAREQVNAMLAHLVPHPHAIAPRLRWMRAATRTSVSFIGDKMNALLRISG